MQQSEPIDWLGFMGDLAKGGPKIGHGVEGIGLSGTVYTRNEADGWYLERVTGSHRKFRHVVKPGTTTIAGKLSDTLPPGTEKSLLKQAGIERRRR